MPIIQSKLDSNLRTLRNSLPTRSINPSKTGIIHSQRNSPERMKLPQLGHKTTDSDTRTSKSVKRYKIENMEEATPLDFVRKSQQSLHSVVVNTKFFTIRESQILKQKRLTDQPIINTARKQQPRQSSLSGQFSIRQFSSITALQRTQDTTKKLSPRPHQNQLGSNQSSNFDIQKLCTVSTHHFNTMCLDILRCANEEEVFVYPDGSK